MAIVFWDASGLAKRYTQEVGRETVNIVFAAVPAHDMAVTAWVMPRHIRFCSASTTAAFWIGRH